jgi:RNA polymerase subunit RPABC4/transcription elongation factor Spt4
MVPSNEEQEFLEIDALIARGLQVLIALGGAYFIALWFVLIVWTFRDIESRSRSVVTQVLSTLLAVLFWIPGMALYWVLRPKETLDEAYQRSLEEEYLIQDLEEVPLCPNCQHFVEDDFQLCPHCQTQLKDNCHHCDRLVDLRWPVCPYCGEQQHHHHEHAETDKVDSPDDRWIDPSAIEERLRKQEELRVRSETRALPMATASMETVRDLLGSPGRRVNQPETTESAEPIPQPAHHDRSAETATAAKASDEPRNEANSDDPANEAEAARNDGDSDDDHDDNDTESSPNGSEPQSKINRNGASNKPGPTSVPKRFKVN